jgi:hypothetical protein
MLPLVGCEPANQVVAHMERFFDSLDASSQRHSADHALAKPEDAERYLITGPGYAPAYPQYHVPGEPPAQTSNN